MTTQAPMSVTFDSNVWESIANLDKLAVHADGVALGEIRRVIEDKRAVPYISDVVVLLESIAKKERGKFFGGIKTTMRRSEDGMSTEANGVPVIKSTLTVSSVFDHFPQLHEKLSSAAVKDKYGAIRGFEIAAIDGKFRWAQARKDGQDLVVFSD